MRVPLKSWLLLLCTLLTACASTPPPPLEESIVTEEGSWACESPEEEQCFTLVCGGETCALFRREETEPGVVVPTRGGGTITAPNAALHYWVGVLIRSPQGKPVFIIPWGGKPLLPSQKLMLEEARRLAKEPHEKHHIFPRQEELKQWFEAQGVNVHEETILLTVETHRRIHDGANGGPWNEAWRQYRRSHEGATKQEMYEHAWKLLQQFNLTGFIVPYRAKPPYLLTPPIGY